ncbi:ion transporter, partial [Mycobacterium tuberculosis]|nr:ion transporter [Mycobacterium tuberculosis]
YGLRVWVADLHPPLARLKRWRARLTYMAGPMAIVDLFAFAPTAVGFLLGFDDVNVFVIFRLVRFLKLARYSPGMGSLATALRTERRALVATA